MTSKGKNRLFALTYTLHLWCSLNRRLEEIRLTGPQRTHHMKQAARVLAIIISCLQIVSVGHAQLALPSEQGLITAPIDESNLVTLVGNTHPLARPEFDIGAAPPDLPLERMFLVLKRSREQQSALKKLLDDQQDKNSVFYHKWLTPEEFGQKFGPSGDDINEVTYWLTKHGFTVDRVSKGRTVIEFSGTASQLQSAMHTSIHKFTVGGTEHWANASDPQIPAAIAPVVAGPLTLHNFYKAPQVKVIRDIQAKAVPGEHPQFTAGSEHALVPADFYKIYNGGLIVSPGTGKIAVLARSNVNQSDITYFHFWTNDQAGTFNLLLNGPDPGELGGADETEAVLDTTWAGAVDPLAWVDLVVSKSTNTTDGVDLSEEFVIEANLAGVMSESYGDCEANYTSAQAAGISALAQQAAAQGITYVVAAGDSGSAGCDDPNTETKASHPPSVNILASTPYTIAVGGTMFNENGQDAKYWNTNNDSMTLGSALSYIPENAWNESCSGSSCAGGGSIWAGGGGASQFFQKPPWQTGVTGIPADKARDLPDVAFTTAAHDPYLICLFGSCVPDAQGNIKFVGVAGTSASTPAFAAVMANVEGWVLSRQGQANYVLYRLATTESLSQCNASNTAGLPAPSCVFNDVTVGNNSVPGETDYGTSSAKYQSTKGYDLATGLGSVNILNLLKVWNSVSFSPTTTTATFSPTNFTHGDAVVLTAKVSGGSGKPAPTGSLWLLQNPAYSIPGENLVQLFTLDSTGSVSITTHTLPGGGYNIVAHYPGDGTYGSSESTPTILSVQPEATTATMTVQGKDANGNLVPFTSGSYGSSVYVSSHVAGQSGYGAPTGSINIYDGRNSVSGAALDGQGNAQAILTQLSAGSHILSLGYSGDPSFLPSAPPPAAPITITTASTTIALASQTASQGATLVATVTGTGAGSGPTGTVSFYSGATMLGSASLISNSGPTQSTATFADSTLAQGHYSITAKYAGDTNYGGSTSAPVSVAVEPDFTLAPSSSSLIVTRGMSNTVALTIGGNDGYKGTITFSPQSCSGLPSESSCAFSPSSVTGAGQVTITISTKAPSQAILRADPGHLRLAWLGSVGTLVLFGLVSYPLGSSGRRRFVLLIVGLSLLLSLAGCGGGSSTSGNGGSSGGGGDPGTPVGSYVVTVTATSGSLTHTITIAVTVE
jgi:Pro-kumamolisin, activation domain/Bacterial Ig-like domain (group 3)